MEAGDATILFCDRRGAHVTRPDEAWVFYIHLKHASSSMAARLTEEMFVAIYSLLHVGLTERRIVELSSDLPLAIAERLNATGCCELRLYSRLPCFSEGEPEGGNNGGHLVRPGCHNSNDGSRTVLEAMRMFDFKAVAMVNTDVQFVRAGVDSIFQSLRDMAVTPTRGESNFGTKQWCNNAQVNTGLIVVRPSHRLASLVDLVRRCKQFSHRLNEQILINQVIKIIWDSRLPIGVDCLSHVFNCQVAYITNTLSLICYN